MGTLIRLLLTLLGRSAKVDRYLSPVSKTIESLPCPDRVKWFWGGFLHFLPVCGAIAILFAFRHSAITHSAREVIALLLAAAWAWLGPVLIWYYEKHTLAHFESHCKHIVVDSNDLQAIHRAVYENINDLTFTRIFSPLWVGAVVLAFTNVHAFVQGFAISGYSDWLWWVLLAGVGLISYYTSIGFALAYKAIVLTNLIAASKLDSHIFHPDGVFGLSFIGDFAFLTAAMFFSGWLFAPLLFFSVSPQGVIGYLTSTPILLLIVLFAFTIFSFVTPIYAVHSKILVEKKLRSKPVYDAANAAAGAVISPLDEERVRVFDFARRLMAEVQAIPNWPLRVDTAVKFVLTSIFFPALATAVAAVLRVKTGAS